MEKFFEAVRVTDRVYWVGAIDWNVRNFHGYTTSRGSTYNAFLVLAEKVTLIDTVKAPFFDEMMARIRSVIDPAQIDYVVSNHSEMDHSGSIPAALATIQPEKLFASIMGEKALKAHFGAGLPVTAVKNGDSISLGDDTLTFVETRMLHWPDSMVSYLAKEKVLFSQDAFGMHLASTGLFADELPKWLLEQEAKKYFANILLLQAPKILALLDALPGLKLDIEIIAPDHGPLWRDSLLATPLENYRRWALQRDKKRGIVLYDTMWHSTEAMALAIADGMRTAGCAVDVVSMASNDRSAVMTLLMDADLIAIGSPTMNNQIFPTMADVLTYMKGLKPQNLRGFAFGSYGWSGEAPKQIDEAMRAMGICMTAEPLRAQYVPTKEDLQKAFETGKALVASRMNQQEV